VNEQIIHSEADLIDTLRKVLDKGIFRIVSRENRSSQDRSDLIIKAQVAGRTTTFAAECKLNRRLQHWNRPPVMPPGTNTIARHRPPFGSLVRNAANGE